MIDNSRELAQQDFEGPLFIVGMQRSGTKLLRGLLNGHSQIGISPIETNFLPYWQERWHTFGDLSNQSNFEKFYEHVTNHPYFLYHKKQVGNIIDSKVWYDACQDYSLASVFEVLIRHDTKLEGKTQCIWGDKSPQYINHIPVLKSIFPQSKIIHIVRDVRDYCLSMHFAWKKNMLRAAQRWTESVARADADAHNFPNDYLVIQYEELLDNPEGVLQQCCLFLGLKFEQSMVELKNAPENIGQAKGQANIVKANKKKYATLMQPAMQKRIEEIAAPSLRAHGYEVTYIGEPKRVPDILMKVYKVIDGLKFIYYESRREGFLDILSIEFGAYLTNR